MTTFLASANTFNLVQSFTGGINVSYTPQTANAGSTSNLGYSLTNTTLPASQSLASNTIKNWYSTTLPTGVWMVTLGIQLTPVGTATISSLQNGLYTTANGLTASTLMSSGSASETLTLTNGQGYSYAISFVLTPTATTTFFYNLNVVYTVATNIKPE